MLREGTRDRIYRAAVESMSELGFHAATTDKIAEVAGVSIGTLYNYFRSKDDILAYIFERELDRRRSALAEIRQMRLGTAEKLRLVLSANARQVQRDPHLARLIWGERGLGRGQAVVRRFLRSMVELFEQLLEDGIAADEFRVGDTRLMARLILGSVEAVLAEYVLEDPQPQMDLDPVVADLVDLLLHGFGQPGAPAARPDPLRPAL